MTRFADLLARFAAAPKRGLAIVAFSAAGLSLSGLVVFVVTSASSHGRGGAPPFAFLTSALGAPTKSPTLVRHPAKGTQVAIGHTGYTVSHGSHVLTLDSPQLGRGNWHPFENGAARRTGFGSVAMAINSTDSPTFAVRCFPPSTLSTGSLRPCVESDPKSCWIV